MFLKCLEVLHLLETLLLDFIFTIPLPTQTPLCYNLHIKEFSVR